MHSRLNLPARTGWNSNAYFWFGDDALPPEDEEMEPEPEPEPDDDDPRSLGFTAAEWDRADQEYDERRGC